MKLSNYKDKSANRKVAVVFSFPDAEDEVLNVRYDESAYTEDLIDSIQSTTKLAAGATDEAVAEQALSSLSKMLLALVVEWDLLDDDDKAVPLTAATLRTLPITFISRIVEKVVEDQNPGND